MDKMIYLIINYILLGYIGPVLGLVRIESLLLCEFAEELQSVFWVLPV